LQNNVFNSLKKNCYLKKFWKCFRNNMLVAGLWHQNFLRSIMIIFPLFNKFAHIKVTMPLLQLKKVNFFISWIAQILSNFRKIIQNVILRRSIKKILRVLKCSKIDHYGKNYSESNSAQPHNGTFDLEAKMTKNALTTQSSLFFLYVIIMLILR